MMHMPEPLNLYPSNIKGARKATNNNTRHTVSFNFLYFTLSYTAV